MAAKEAKARMQAIIASRSITQIVLDLRVLDGMDYSGEVALVHKMYCDHVEAVYPSTDARVWELIDLYDAEGQHLTYSEALQLALGL